MKVSRRKLIATSALTGTVISLSGCLSRANHNLSTMSTDSEVRVRFSGNVSTGSPIIKRKELSTQSSYPNYYSAAIKTNSEKDRIRFEYIQKEVPQLESKLTETDFDSEYLIFFGMVLPRSQQLSSGEADIKNNNVYFEYTVEESGSSSTELVINTNIRRIEGRAPEDIEYNVTF